MKIQENIKHPSEEQSQSLHTNFGHMTRNLFTNEQKNLKKGKSSRYSDSIKQFAVSLHFHSPKANAFVRKSLHLISQAIIRAWAAVIECNPGFLTNVVQHLQNTLKDDDKDYWFYW